MRSLTVPILLAALLIGCRTSAVMQEEDEPGRLADPVGDWSVVRSDLEAPTYTDLTGAVLGVISDPETGTPRRLGVQLDLFLSPPEEGPTAVTYGARLDLDGNRTDDIRADLFYAPEHGWHLFAHRLEGGEAVLDTALTATLRADAVGNAITLWLDGVHLAEAGWQATEGLSWWVEAAEYEVPPSTVGTTTAYGLFSELVFDVGPVFADQAPDAEEEGDDPRDTPPPVIFGEELERVAQERRCAVVVGDNTLGIGPKDARDFHAMLLTYPEWQAPRGRFETIFANASNASVEQAIRRLHGQGCRQLVFFYSGHGGNRNGDRQPRDERHADNHRGDEYLDLRNQHDNDADAAHTLYDDVLGPWLRDWQVSNRYGAIEPGASQGVYRDPELLVVLHACHGGGFIGGNEDLDRHLHPPYEFIAGGAEDEVCQKVVEPPPGQPPTNSFFVENLLEAMDISGGDHDVTGSGAFSGADDETTDDAEAQCPPGATCSQHPVRTSQPAGFTVELHGS